MGRASAGAEGGSCDALRALRLSWSPNRTMTNPAQLPMVQSTRTPARLSAPRATVTEVMGLWQGALEMDHPLHQATKQRRAWQLTLVIASGVTAVGQGKVL